MTAATGLELRGVVWAAACGAYEIDTDPLWVEPGAVGVIVAEPTVGSALADVIVGLCRPLRGTVSLDGRPVADQTAGKRPVTLVPCGGGLLPHLTVERNVGFGLGGRLSRRARHARVSEVLAQLQLESLRRFRPHEISGVQRLRVAVARALCASVEAVAVVIEDRQGQFPCRAAVMTAVDQDLSVLVITDSPGRGAALGAMPQAACRLTTDPAPRGAPPVACGPAAQ